MAGFHPIADIRTGPLPNKPRHLLPAAQARERAALAFESSRRHEALSRAEAFVAALQADLAKAARCHAIAAGIIGELAAEDLTA